MNSTAGALHPSPYAPPTQPSNLVSDGWQGADVAPLTVIKKTGEFLTGQIQCYILEFHATPSNEWQAADQQAREKTQAGLRSELAAARVNLESQTLVL